MITSIPDRRANWYIPSLFLLTPPQCDLRSMGLHVIFIRPIPLQLLRTSPQFFQVRSATDSRWIPIKFELLGICNGGTQMFPVFHWNTHRHVQEWRRWRGRGLHMITYSHTQFCVCEMHYRQPKWLCMKSVLWLFYTT